MLTVNGVLPYSQAVTQNGEIKSNPQFIVNALYL